MHVSCGSVAIHAGVDEENISAHAGKSAQCSESGRASTNDDSVEIGTSARRLTGQNCAIGHGSQRSERCSNDGSHFQWFACALECRNRS